MFWVWFKFTLHFIIPSAGTGPPRPIPRALLHFSATAHPARPHPTNHELPTGSRIFAAGAAAAAVAPSPPPSRPATSLRFEVLPHPSAPCRFVLPSAAAAAPRGCAVASSCYPAPRRCHRPEGRGDGARPAPRRSRCGITPLLVPAAFGFVLVLVVLGKRSRILCALFLSQMVIRSNLKRKRNHHSSDKRIVKCMLVLGARTELESDGRCCSSIRNYASIIIYNQISTYFSHTLQFTLLVLIFR